MSSARPNVSRKAPGAFHRAAKGGRKRGQVTFCLFWPPFGDDFVTFFDVFGHFFVYHLLPPPFCGRATFPESNFVLDGFLSAVVATITTSSLAHDHAVVDSDCGPKASIFRIAAGRMASWNGACWNNSVAKAQNVFVMFRTSARKKGRGTSARTLAS